MPDTYVEPEQAVRDGAVQTFRELLPIVAPNICGYEMRALPSLVVEGAKRLRANADHMTTLYRQRRDDAVEAEDQVCALRGTLETLHDELANFAHYSRAVAEECVGQRRLMWQERTEWAERLATLASTSAAPPRKLVGSDREENR
jgi:hypothetical protein